MPTYAGMTAFLCFQAAVRVLQRFQPEKGGRKKNRAGWMARFFVWGRYGAGRDGVSGCLIIGMAQAA